jgi:tetratricopeptide (TPR) repeat protein
MTKQIPSYVPRWQTAVVVAATCVVYLNSFRNELLWDDLHLIVDNPAIKHWSRVPGLFLTELFPHGTLSNYYRPLQALTYLIDYSIWGLHPLGYHLTNVLLHVGVALLLQRLVALLLQNATAGLIAALLFAVHPIHTEAVTYVAGRSDPLSALFMLAALLWFACDPRPGLSAPRLLSLTAFFLALLAREAAVVLILLLVLVERMRPTEHETCPPWRDSAVRCAPYLAVLAAYVAWRAAVVGLAAHVSTAPAQVPLHLRVCTMGQVIVEYLALLLVPLDQHMERLVHPAASCLEASVLGATVLMGAIFAGTAACRRRARPVALGVAWFFIALLPVSNLVPLSTFMAEHWLYVPSMGLFLIAGWGASQLADRGWAQPVVTGVLIAVAAYGGLTMRRNLDWRDGRTLYQATLRLAPHSARAWTNLGHAYQEAGDLDRAREAYERALRLSPAAADVVQNLGGTEATEGRPENALAAYERALMMDTSLADPHNNLGNIYREQGKHEEAEREFREALRLDPAHAAARSNLGLTLQAVGRADEAEQSFIEALRIDPDSASAHNNLGNVHFRRGELERARGEYLAAIRLNPDYAEAFNNLGSVQFRIGRADLAEEAYRRALHINPGLDEVRRNLSIVLRSRERVGELANPTPIAPTPRGTRE